MKSIYMASGSGVPDPNKPKRDTPPDQAPAETPKAK